VKSYVKHIAKIVHSILFELGDIIRFITLTFLLELVVEQTTAGRKSLFTANELIECRLLPLSLIRKYHLDRQTPEGNDNILD